MTLFDGNKAKWNFLKKRPLKEIGLFLADILYNAVIIIFLVIVIRTFLISPFRVIGSSMADTLHNNEFILIDKLSYNIGEPKRGDPIVFLPPITNKYPHKFEESVKTDDKGVGILDISNLRTEKQIFYCQNKLIKKVWFCKDKVKEKDIVYYRINDDAEQKNAINSNWKQAKNVTADEINKKKIIINGTASSNYIIRIYNSTGPEYFVKRIIGIPGDAIKIENGRVYLKTDKSNSFAEINEIYLNNENKFNTYFQKIPGINEFKVAEGQYFVLGDNRNHSNDSRHWFSPINEGYTPYVNKEDINGKVLVVLWPPQNLRFLDSGILK